MGIREAVGRTLSHAWNTFVNLDKDPVDTFGYGPATYSMRPDTVRRTGTTSERTILASILNLLSRDVAAVDIRHVRLDEQDRFLSVFNSGLNNCLTVEANIDQAARHFRQDIAMSMFSEGVIAIVPVDTTLNPALTAGYDIKTMRVGTIVNWYPKHLRVELYNDETGRREQVTVLKEATAVVENPLYSVMNEQNSTLQRLIRKLNLLDIVDEASSSGKLDLIIQLPYVVKSESRRNQAEQRRKEVEFQLKGSKYGIAYTDGTEKITQLNRPAENNLLEQVKFLTAMLYAQLGLTEEVMNGTADEKTMLNYNTRTIEPIVTAIVEAMRRTFLSKTARAQKQWILSFRDPFRLVPLSEFAEIADKLTRSEVASSNELRQGIGLPPSTDPKANELRNTNMPAPSEPVKPIQEGEAQNDSSQA
jgi:portal protein